MLMESLAGKIAIVSGGASGMGRAIATSLRALGASVVIGDIDLESGLKVAAEIDDSVVAVKCDVTSRSDFESLVRSAKSEFGALHVLVNCAGIAGEPGKLTADSTEENFDSVVGVNLKGQYLGMRAAIPAILESGGGSIVNIASVVGMVGAPYHTAYAASKAGVIAMSRCAAVEYAKLGIRVNVISPGPIDTPMLRGRQEIGDSMADATITATAFGRLGLPSEIASVAAFLASDSSSFITGAVIPVDGGYTAL